MNEQSQHFQTWW